MIKTQKPICAYCSKRYGSYAEHIESVFCPDDPNDPTKLPKAEPYRGNDELRKEYYSPDEPGWRRGDRSVEIPKPNPLASDAYHGTSITLKSMLDGDRRTGRTIYRTIRRTGEFVTPYAPFCTLRCGLAFAQGAYNVGYRMPEKDDPAS